MKHSLTFLPRVILSSLLLGIAILSLPGHAAPLPSGTALLPANSVTAFSQPSGAVKIVPVTHMPFTQALRCVTAHEPTNAWDLQIGATATAPIKKNDVLYATFWMRSVDAHAPTGRTDLILEDAHSYDKSVYYSAVSGKAWRKFQVPFLAARDEAQGDAHINFHLGFTPQTVEIGGVRVVDYGQNVAITDLPKTKITYDGRALNAPWRKAAQARIEKYRKDNLTVIVTSHGKPVSGAQVHIAQTKHAFAFGSEVDRKAFEDNPDGLKYRTMAAQLFNRVVFGLGFKWEVWEGQWDGYTHAETLNDIAWMHQHGVSVRGHNLVWQSWSYLPRDIPTLAKDHAALRKRILDHITSEVTTLKGQCVEWDVVNEPNENHMLTDILGKHAIVDWYQAAHRADPKARLFINEDGITNDLGEDTHNIDSYDGWISYLLANKAPLGGIGLESHMTELLSSPDQVYGVLNKFARHHIPLEITEYDTNSPDHQLQADYLHDYLTICFSHPDVEGFLMWGFWAGDHGQPDAALLTNDWQFTPAGQVWKNLVYHRWWTDTKGSTNARGIFATRGFLGSYTITVTKAGKTYTKHVSLAHPGTRVWVAL